jgi:hypothetical protein
MHKASYNAVWPDDVDSGGLSVARDSVSPVRMPFPIFKHKMRQSIIGCPFLSLRIDNYRADGPNWISLQLVQYEAGLTDVALVKEDDSSVMPRPENIEQSRRSPVVCLDVNQPGSIWGTIATPQKSIDAIRVHTHFAFITLRLIYNNITASIIDAQLHQMCTTVPSKLVIWLEVLVVQFGGDVQHLGDDR